MKLIRKAKWGINIPPIEEAKSDNTRVVTYYPEIPLNESKGLIVSTTPIIKADRRSPLLREVDYRVGSYLNNQELIRLNTAEGLAGISTFVSPSTYIGPLFRNNGKDYSTNMMSGEGTGNTVGNLVTDVAVFGLPGIVRRGFLNSSKTIDYSKVINPLKKDVKFKDFDFKYNINRDPFSSTSLPISNDVKIDHSFKGDFRYKDYGTIPLYENVGSDIPDYVKKAREFYKKDVQWRENKNKIDEFKYDPFRFYRTYNEKAPVLVREYLDKTPFGGYAEPANNSLVMVRNTNFDPYEILIHEGTHRDLFKALNKFNSEDPIKNVETAVEYRIYRDNPDLNFSLNPSRRAYSSDELELLDDAYLFEPGYLKKNNADDILEKGATNRQLRAFISSKFGDKYGPELDQIIDNLSDDDLLYWLSLTNGYGHSFVKLSKNLGIPRNVQSSKIKKALKYVPVLSPLINIQNYETNK